MSTLRTISLRGEWGQHEWQDILEHEDEVSKSLDMQ